MPPPRSMNPLRRERREINAPTAVRKPVTAPRAKRACPNKQCTAPDVQEGICQNCGVIVDESNIVAEVQFSENSSGAAVVQGSYIGADQGGVRSMGPGMRRMGGEEGREATIRTGRQRINGFANQLRNISDTVIAQGVQLFKLAAMNNFIQGRRIETVAAVCLYTACRKEQPCTIMLIDFADLVQLNVFKLGKIFKDLHVSITIAGDGVRPILPEDLIYRFAAKLEFGPHLDKVADDACRLVKRMSFDWMSQGRRPSGVCGACLVLAARMNNYRRTITEVVYVVKVTTHTIKKRLEEFKRTSSSKLTIEEFLNEEWSRSDAHDPPSFYERTEDFQKTRKKNKKRKIYNPDDVPEDTEETTKEKPKKKQKTVNNGKGKEVAVMDKSAALDTHNGIPQPELRRDADGFAIPPRPQQYDDIPIDPELLGEENDARNDKEREVDKMTLAHVGDLIGAFGDSGAEAGTEENDEDEDEDDGDDEDNDEDDAEIIAAMDKSVPRTVDPLIPIKGFKGPDHRPIHTSEEWEADEQSLQNDITMIVTDPSANRIAKEVVDKRAAPYITGDEEPSGWASDDENDRPRRTEKSVEREDEARLDSALDPLRGIVPASSKLTESIMDPHSAEHIVSYEDASILAAKHIEALALLTPARNIPMDREIGEDEFADDEEVNNCLLTPEASATKEKIWVNENRHWLRKQQLREYQRQMAANGPPKATRNRKKKPKIGEGVSTASSPAEAAVDLMKQRSYSKRINYDAISAMFDKSGGGHKLGSAATSRVTSVAGSRETSVALSEADSDISMTSSILTPNKDPKEYRRTQQIKRRAAKKAALDAEKARASATPTTPTALEIDEEEHDSDDSDYVRPDDTPAGKTGQSEVAQSEPGDNDALDEDEDYGFENGDVDPFADNVSVGGQSTAYDEDGY